MKQNLDRLVCKPQGSRIPSEIWASVQKWNENTCSQRSFPAPGGSQAGRYSRAGLCVKGMLWDTMSSCQSKTSAFSNHPSHQYSGFPKDKPPRCPDRCSQRQSGELTLCQQIAQTEGHEKITAELHDLHKCGIPTNTQACDIRLSSFQENVSNSLKFPPLIGEFGFCGIYVHLHNFCKSVANCCICFFIPFVRCPLSGFNKITYYD